MPVALLGRLRLSTGWWMVLDSAVCMMVGSGLYFWALGIYVRPLEEEFGWSRTAISGAASLIFLVSGITGPLVGAVIDRAGARRPIVAGTLGLAFSFVWLARINSLWQCYALYAMMAFTRSWASYIPFLWLVSRWFPYRMGTPVGVMSLGFSAAGLLFVPLVTWMVATFGWRQSFVFSGVIIAAVILPLASLLREPAAPGSAAAAARRQSPGPDFSLRSALRTRAFWLLAVGLGLFFMGLISFTFHAVPFFLSRGFSEGEAAAWVGSIAAGSTVIRVGLGYLIDRTADLRKFAVSVGVIPALGLIILAFSTAPLGLVAFVLLWSIGAAVGPITESVLLSRTFGTANFGAILGALGVAETVGTVIGPLAGGVIFDASGSYTAALLLYAAAFLAASGAFALGDYSRP